MKRVGTRMLALAATIIFAYAGRAAADIGIVVNFGRYPAAEHGAIDEANINWSDADFKDDTACTECFAAVELQHYFRKMAGTDRDFDVVDDQALPGGSFVLIGGPGSNAASKSFLEPLGVKAETLDALAPEAYIIKNANVDGRQVTLVAGGGRVGTLYGVYDLLHRLGVRWYAPGDINEEVPELKLDRLPDFDLQESPMFFTRGFHAWENRGTPDFLLWMARNRMNYWCVDQEEKAMMHKLGIMLVGGGHILTEFYLSPRSEYPYNHPKFDGDDDKPADPYAPGSDCQGDANGDGKLSYFEAHPEWYGLQDGKRSDRIHGDGGDNFCTSNRDAMAEWTKNAVQDLAEGQYKDAGFINAWTLDVGRWCQCEKCKALGTQTDRNLDFVYHYDKAIKQAQAEGRINRPIRLLFLAYADVLEPPTRALPEDFDYETCIATYFPIRRCYVHNFDDPNCSPNAKYLKHLYGWAVDPERFYKGQLCIGEYYNVSGYKCLPICFMHTMQNDIPYYYRETGARHFHYMHCTVGNWGNKALTNWQMARQIWNPDTDCSVLWEDYFNGRYGPAAAQMRGFYEGLEQMLSNCSELKYGLARRLDRGIEDLFNTTHLKYERTAFEKDDGPDLLEILDYAAQCRAAIDGVMKMDLPERIAHRVAEDERLFTYGERTVKFYDALCRAYFLAREGKTDEARAPLKEAQEIADLLKADTTSTTLASSHANAPDALAASYASGALAILLDMLGPAEPAELKVFDPAQGALTLTGKEFAGGGGARHGHGLHVFPGRIPVSEVGNYVYGAGTKPFDHMKAWFRLEKAPEKDIQLTWQGLKCPEPIGGDVKGQVLVNGEAVFEANVPFSEKELTTAAMTIPKALLKAGENTIEIRNVQPNGQLSGRPWFGIDHVELRVE